jgi:hypothetical protein
MILTRKGEIKKGLIPICIKAKMRPIVSLEKIKDAHLFPRDQELYRNYEEDFFY